MSSLKQKVQKKRKARAPPEDDDDALIAALEKKLGGKKQAQDDPFAELGGGDDASEDDAVPEAEPTTEAHYAPRAGQDIYGRQKGEKWVPPSLRRRRADAPERDLGEVLRGPLNKVSDATIVETAEAVCGAYATFPANDVHAFVSKHLRDTCVHGAQNMGALVPPYAAVIAATDARGGRELGAHVLEGLRADLDGAGKRRLNGSGVLAALCDVGLCGGELPLSYAEALQNEASADALEACSVVVRGARDVWRRGDATKGRLSALGVASADTDDARLSQAKDALRSACASKPDDRRLARSKALRASVARAVPAGQLRGAPLALSWSDLKNAESTGRWWRRGAAYDRHAQQALEGDVQTRRAEMRAKPSWQEATMRALRMNTPAKRAAFGGVANAQDAQDAAQALAALVTKRLCDDRCAAGVLQACCGGEPTYNPFYAAVACIRRGLSKDFAFGLKLSCWDAFRAADAGEDPRKAMRRAANLGKFCGALLGSELPLATAFAKVDARGLLEDASAKVAVLSALRCLLVETDDARFAAALQLEPSEGAADVESFARARLRRPPSADAGAWAGREAALFAWFGSGDE